jgi:hypothetical protein
VQVRDPDEVLVGEPGRWLPSRGATLSHRSGARQAPAKLVSPDFRAKTLMQLGWGDPPPRLFAVDLCTSGLGDGQCRECRIAIWLGKPSRSCGGNSRTFHDVTAERFSN